MFFQAYMDPDFGLFILRLIVGIVFIYHGWPKIVKAGNFVHGMGLPAWAVWGVGIIEFVGGIGLIFGFWTQLFSALIAFVMIGAMYKKMSVWRVPFSTQGATGWEFDLVLLATCLAIFFTGGGYMPNWF